jgi:hypothetical protein
MCSSETLVTSTTVTTHTVTVHIIISFHKVALISVMCRINYRQTRPSATLP